MSHSNIVITGFDLVSALGIGAEEASATLSEGESAIMPPMLVAPPDGVEPVAGETPDFDLRDMLPTPKTYLDRHSKLLLAAAALARGKSQLENAHYDPERVGLSIGTTWGGAGTLEMFFEDYIQKGPRLVKPILFPHSYANAAISLVAMEWEIRGSHLNFVSDQTASSQALIAAHDMLWAGEADLVMAGGTESLSAVRWRGRLARSLLNPPGEAAAVFVLERRENAIKRGIQPLAVLSGGAMVGGADQFAAAANAVAEALERAQLSEDEVGTVLTTRQTSRFVPNKKWETFVADEFYGDVEGASGAMLAAIALLKAEVLPALCLTVSNDATATAFVIRNP